MAEAEQQIVEKGYAHPEALVTTEWVAEHQNDENVRIVESDEDVLLYDIGHIQLRWLVDRVGQLGSRSDRAVVVGPQEAYAIRMCG